MIVPPVLDAPSGRFSLQNYHRPWPRATATRRRAAGVVPAVRTAGMNPAARSKTAGASPAARQGTAWGLRPRQFLRLDAVLELLHEPERVGVVLADEID